jgi:hypothetical protein
LISKENIRKFNVNELETSEESELRTNKSIMILKLKIDLKIGIL